MRIRIIGCSGSGKTYLAKRLGKKYGITPCDLDEIFWDTDGYGIKRSTEDRLALLDKTTGNPDWIIEGIYYAWCEETFSLADKIYLLVVPLDVCKRRIRRRFIRRKLGLERGKRESLKSVKDLLKWTEKFQAVNLVEIKALLEKYKHKVTVIDGRKEIL